MIVVFVVIVIIIGLFFVVVVISVTIVVVIVLVVIVVVVVFTVIFFTVTSIAATPFLLFSWRAVSNFESKHLNAKSTGINLKAASGRELWNAPEADLR